MTEQPQNNSQQEEAERLRAPTVEADGRRRWLYPERLGGKRAKFRERLALLLMLIYLVVPFVKIGGNPLLRISFLDQKAYFFGASFGFHEAYFFVFVLIILMLTLFLFTSIQGRIWCGYACPQTVFVDWLIRPIEELIEGNANRRRRIDKEPMSFAKVGRKILKHAVYIAVLLVISNAFLAYFVAPKTLIDWVSSPPSEQPFAFGVMIFVFAALYFDLVWFREQFCAFLCPYARFQTVMFDERTPVISYDYNRGEPRGRRGKVGDCIDCNLCVRVCPTGIDIRQGLQLECIQCARCADACDMVMGNLKRPLGLIRHCSEADLEGQKSSSRRIRPWIYGVLLALITVGFIGRIVLRNSLDVRFLRQSGTTYAVFDNDSFANYFQMKLSNRSGEIQKLELLASPEVVKVICGLCDQPIDAGRDMVGQLIVIMPKNFPAERVALEFSHGIETELALIKPVSQ